MDSREFETWLARNEGKGGKKISYDPFNKAKKGSERNPAAKEYSNVGTEEYHKYSERREERKEDDRQDNDQTSDPTRSRGSRRRNGKGSGGVKNAGRSASRVVQNVIGRAVASIVCGVMIVSGYQGIKAHEAEKTFAARTVAEVTWEWAEDDSGVSVELFNAQGYLIERLPAVITVTTEDPSCTKEGLITYTATVVNGDDTYTDHRYKKLEATGHDLGEGKEVTLENGQKAVQFECEHCHELFTIAVTYDED